MTAILIFIVIIIGLNLIPQLTKKNFPKTEKAIIQILILTTVTFIILTILLFNGFKLKGLYSNSIIGLIFILISLSYFLIVKYTKRKLVSIFLLIPVVLLSIYLQVFNQTVGCFKITNDLNIVISREGFLGCGEIIRLTTSKFGIFDKELIYDSNQCLRGISKIETVEFNNKQAKFLIYHNGEMDSENPYHYEIDNRNVW